jgi:hypothetical protein
MQMNNEITPVSCARKMDKTSHWWLEWANGWTLDGVQVCADFYWGWNVEIYVDLPRYAGDGKFVWTKRWLIHPDSMLPFKGKNGWYWYGDLEEERRYAEHCRLSKIHSFYLLQQLKSTRLDFESWPETIRLKKFFEDLTIQRPYVKMCV